MTNQTRGPEALAWVHRLAVFTCGATFVLLCAGALVTSTGSGLAVPDWPLSFGRFFPRMTGGVLYEHGHRMIAGFVGILAFVLAIVVWLKETRRWVRVLAAGSFLVVVIQALLGGLTVLMSLPDAVSIGHAATAQVFFCLMVSLAFFTSRSWRIAQGHARPAIFSGLTGLSALLTAAVYVQVLLGAVFRHSGQAISFHIVGAACVAFLAGLVFARIVLGETDDRLSFQLAAAQVGLILLQLGLGPAALVLKATSGGYLEVPAVRAVLTALHTVFGALTLGVSLLTTLRLVSVVRVRSGEAIS